MPLLDGRTPLFAAAANVHSSVVHYLCEIGAGKVEDWRMPLHGGRTPLTAAAATDSNTRRAHFLLDWRGQAGGRAHAVGQRPVGYPECCLTVGHWATSCPRSRRTSRRAWMGAVPSTALTVSSV